MALPHATSGEPVNLRPFGSRFAEARTTALVKTDSFEAIRLVIASGHSLPPHKVSGKFTLHCLEGRVRLGLSAGTVELAADDWVFFEGGVLHSLEGIEDSSLLLTIMLADSNS